MLADKKQMPEGNFRQVCPRIGSLRGEGLRHRPRAFLLRDFDAGFDAGTRIEGSPESLGLRPYRFRNGVLLQHQPDDSSLGRSLVRDAAQNIDG